MILIIIVLYAVVILPAQDIEIRQVDTRPLLFHGEMDIYFSVYNADSAVLDSGDFTVTEESAGQLSILSFDQAPNLEEGIDFLLLVDNSGSMYEEIYQGRSRISQAKTALGFFLEQIDDEKDQVAVYAFNTSLEELAPFGTSAADIRRSLSALEEPSSEMAYTELYNSLTEAVNFFPKTSGRRAVIVLSDGENYSFFERGGTSHPEWGEAVPLPEEVISLFHRNGATIDGINLADDKDLHLSEICEATGGQFHDVRTTEAISGVYTAIKDAISNEYRITVNAPPLSDSVGRIELEFNGGNDSRFIFVPLVFGGASDLSFLFPLALLLLGLAGAGLLYYLKFDGPVKSPQIQSLNSHQTIPLNEGGATVIGASRDADYTLSGNPGVDYEHATIIHNEKTDIFTLVSKKSLRVNNRKTKKRVLTPGDVVQIEGNTIIFDVPVTQISEKGSH